MSVKADGGGHDGGGRDARKTNLAAIMSEIAEAGRWQAFFLGTYPRLLRAVLSGAIQFTSYELTRNYFSS